MSAVDLLGHLDWYGNFAGNFNFTLLLLNLNLFVEFVWNFNFDLAILFSGTLGSIGHGQGKQWHPGAHRVKTVASCDERRVHVVVVGVVVDMCLWLSPLDEHHQDQVDEDRGEHDAEQSSAISKHSHCELVDKVFGTCISHLGGGCRCPKSFYQIL